MLKRVLVIGVGFMGGSLCLSLREKFKDLEIFGIDLKEEVIRRAKELCVIDEGFTDYSRLRDVSFDCIFLATPVRTFTDIAQRIRDFKAYLISDLGSVKGSLVYRLEEILGERFVGGHPIAGTEKSGVENSIRGLFEGKRFIITPTERTDQSRKEFLKGIWERLGSEVEEMEPFLHDFVFGVVSHLPHLVAFCLVDCVRELSREINLFKYTGGGFKDFTRIAKSDPVMWKDIFLENGENLLKALKTFKDSLEKLEELVREGREEEIVEYLKGARECLLL